MRTSVLAVLVFLSLAVPVSFTQGVKARPVEQSSFCEDQPLDKPVPVPRGVATLLMSSPAAKEVFDKGSDSELADPAKLFKGSELHLSGSKEVDLVAIGSAPMSGADNGWFWVIGSVRKNPKILLWAGGNCLTLLHSKSFGYKDIQTVWSSPQETITTLYKFDGKQYKQSRKTSKANNWR